MRDSPSTLNIHGYQVDPSGVTVKQGVPLTLYSNIYHQERLEGWMIDGEKRVFLSCFFLLFLF